MQRLNKEPAVAASPRQLEPIASLPAYRPNTASAALTALAPSPASISAAANRHQEESRPAPEPAWVSQPRERGSKVAGLVPVSSPLQYRAGYSSPGQNYVVIEQVTTQQRKCSVSSMTSNSRSSVSKLESRKVSAKAFYKVPGVNHRHGREETREASYASEEDSDSDDSDDLPVGPSPFERRRAQKKLRESLGTTIHEEGGKKFRGSIDNRGITPYVTFTSVETPPSEAKNPIITTSQPTTCGFCSSTNLVWVLRCSFCGSARMSDAPRLKYLIDMILSMEPTIKPDQVSLRAPS